MSTFILWCMKCGHCPIPWPVELVGVNEVRNVNHLGQCKRWFMTMSICFMFFFIIRYLSSGKRNYIVIWELPGLYWHLYNRTLVCIFPQFDIYLSFLPPNILPQPQNFILVQYAVVLADTNSMNHKPFSLYFSGEFKKI